MKYSDLCDEELVKACAQSQDAEAWEEFVRRFRKIIAPVVWRTLRSLGEFNNSIVDDQIQETFCKVCADNCRLLRTFRFEHPKSFRGMLRAVAANVARDYIRENRADKRYPGMPVENLDDVAPFVSDGHSPGAKRIERDILLQQVDQILLENPSATATRDHDIFWFHYRQGYTAAEIAQFEHFDLDVKGVESALHRLRCLLCQALAGRSEHEPEGVPSEKTLSKGEGQS
jgi:RNA polymerase sigma-70 factor, ECF subfamily